ncbi:hypothetical protein CYMTET_48371, partial [Cymbomonas tetramitiformis]
MARPPGAITTLSGRLAIGGDPESQIAGYLHGKPPVDLAAGSDAAPHVVLACKRFKLRAFNARPETSAAESVARPVGSVDFADPLRAGHYRFYVIGPVAAEDAYPPLLQSLRERGDIWEPENVQGYTRRARVQRGRHLWDPGMMVKHNTDLESLGLIPNVQYAPEVHKSRKLPGTPPGPEPRVIALLLNRRREPRFQFSPRARGGTRAGRPSVSVEYALVGGREHKKGAFTAWEVSCESGDLVRGVVGGGGCRVTRHGRCERWRGAAGVGLYGVVAAATAPPPPPPSTPGPVCDLAQVDPSGLYGHALCLDAVREEFAPEAVLQADFVGDGPVKALVVASYPVHHKGEPMDSPMDTFDGTDVPKNISMFVWSSAIPDFAGRTSHNTARG